MTDIRAIETVYNGYRFRSRLEARWAVFFDAADIRYEYEPEGFEVNGERYLPDFYLPELDTYVEVKGKRQGYEYEILKLREFIVWGGPIKQILILSDVPGKTVDCGIWHFPAFYWSVRGVMAGWFFFYDFEHRVKGNLSSERYLGPDIGEWYITRNRFSIDPRSDYSKEMRTTTDYADFFEGWTPPNSWEANQNVANAFKAARQARFEYGESPTSLRG